MSAAKLNLLIEAGATFNLGLTWQDPDGDPINLTGYQARMQVRPTAGADTILLELSSGPGGEITLGGLAGTITLRVGADITDELPIGSGVYDLELAAAADATEVVRLIEGALTVHRQVTR